MPRSVAYSKTSDLLQTADCSKSGHLYESLATVKSNQHNFLVGTAIVGLIIKKLHLINNFPECCNRQTSITIYAVFENRFEHCKRNHQVRF